MFIGGNYNMFNHKKFLEENNLENIQIEAIHCKDTLEVFGTREELLYIASCLINFVLEDLNDCAEAELNFDKGVDLTDESTSLRFFLKK